MSIKKDLLAVGHTALDYIITVDEFPKANNSAPMKTMKNLNGGAAANVAMVGAKLGMKTGLLSAVGCEFINSHYHKDMEKLGIDTDAMIISEDENTSTAFVMTNNNQDQISYFYWGAAKEFHDGVVPRDKLKEFKVVHLATGDPHFNCKSGIVAKEEERLVSFDPGQDLGMYSPKKLKEVISNSNILFGNHHEIKRIQDSLGVDINDLMDLGPEIVIKTCGKEGSFIYSIDEGKIEIDSIYRPAVDPTGAGDSFRSGFLSQFINGASLEESAKFASSVSSFVVEKQGCQTNMPSYDEAYNRMIDFY
ncbi:carbohydrate kinase family protein [Methanobrevibacter olleyae]|uniref:Carbohydrate kinase PfkB family n=1 Tax=Methanobrevibacter olleyae TaxID=294671 RepID=A0A126QYX6_METOL|nr:carbohydrate kinase family protein [Methanobrevibacter olleyae]AMK14575.1 carbohydrate kinase PfkB family [Methanobrevibacter olleyae]SFL27814.1 ribokinase [Methanobrevibacter olleyae]